MPCLLKIYDLANVKPHIHTSVTTKPFWASLTVSCLKLPVWALLIIFFQSLIAPGISAGLEEPAQPWHSAKMWSAEAWSKSQEHWPVPGPSLQCYGQTAPWFLDGKSVTPTSCLNVTHLEVKRRFWMSHFKQSGVWMILLLYGKKFCILYRDMIAVLQEYNIYRHYQTKPW